MGHTKNWFKRITDDTKRIIKQQDVSIPLVYGVVPRVAPPNIIWDTKNQGDGQGA